MPNITLSLPEEMIHQSRQYAKDHHTSLNALIRILLARTVGQPSTEDWIKECFHIMDKAKGDSHGKKWEREDLYRV